MNSISIDSQLFEEEKGGNKDNRQTNFICDICGILAHFVSGFSTFTICILQLFQQQLARPSAGAALRWREGQVLTTSQDCS